MNDTKSAFTLQRMGVIMEPEAGNPREAEGVLNPAAVRGADGQLYLFPRLVAAYASGARAAAISAAATAGSEHFAALGKRLPEMDESAIEALSHEVGTIAL